MGLLGLLFLIRKLACSSVSSLDGRFLMIPPPALFPFVTFEDGQACRSTQECRYSVSVVDLRGFQMFAE